MKSNHPFHAIREPFGKAGLTVAILALVLAMVGGAYAAGALSTQQKKEVEKIARKVVGKPGATGPAGPAGTAGASGKEGSLGAPSVGIEGKQGTSGTDGKNVEIDATASVCPAGGVSVQVAGETSTKKEICNGEDGETGFTETLPSGKTETGLWAGAVFEFGPIPISFNIPLAAPIDEAHTVVVPEDGTPPAECQNPDHAGAAGVENPEARPGYLCIYVGLILEGVVREVTTASDEANGAGTAGTVIDVDATEPFGALEGFVHCRGTWAVTAP